MRSALSLASGIGVSEVTDDRADAVEGNDEAKESTVERTASGESCVGGAVGSADWKSEGCDLSLGE